MSIFAYIGAFIFDIAVQITLQSVTYSQSFLTTSWAAVRDLANMAFIFLLVYLAIVIVLRAETSGSLKMLSGIIIAALLINFSFFITRVVIDGGNILATQFYNAIPEPPLSSSSAASGSIVGSVQAVASAASSNANVKDLTNGIMNALGIQTFIGSNSFSTFASTLTGKSGQAVGGFSILIILTFVYLAVGAILAMLAFTFITVGVKFLVRVVVLWFVIIAAPLAFVAAAIFKGATWDRFNLFKRWQEALIQFAFYPAVFLFIFWIIDLFSSQLGNTNGGLLGASFSTNAASQGAVYTIATVIASVTIRLGIIVAMLFVAMKASDKIANTGVRVVDSFSNKAGTWVSQTVPKRFAGLAYRSPIGPGGLAQRSGKALASTQIGNTALGYGLRKNVLAPIADKSIGGARSRTQVLKDIEARKKETGSNIRTIENKGDNKELSALEKTFDSAKLKALNRIQDNYAEYTKQEKIYNDIVLDTSKGGLVDRMNNEDNLAKEKATISRINATLQARGTPATAPEAAALAAAEANRVSLEAIITSQGPLSGQNKTDVEALRNAKQKMAALGASPALSSSNSDELKKLKEQEQRMNILKTNVNNLSKGEVEATLTKGDIEDIMRHVNEPLMKKIEDSEKYSDKDKAELRAKWHEISDDAPAQKAQKQIELLRKIHDDLRRVHTDS